VTCLESARTDVEQTLFCAVSFSISQAQARVPVPQNFKMAVQTDSKTKL